MRHTAVALSLVFLASCIARASSWATVGSLSLNASDESVTVLQADRPLFEYVFADVPFKPYVKLFYSPAGVNVLRDAPRDHLHHHALMFAIAVDGVNFWEETPGAGRQVHRAIVRTTGRQQNQTAAATFTETLDWRSAKGETLLVEDRSITAHALERSGASLLTWRSVVRAPEGRKSVALSGSHYFGLGMRFVESMDKGGAFTYAGGAAPAQTVRGDERLTRANWCAYSAKADGKEVTVAIFDHPDNPRHPATWFTMGNPFSYIAATLNLSKEPMTLEQGKDLDLCYGVAVWDGKPDAAQIDQLYSKWREVVPASTAR